MSDEVADVLDGSADYIEENGWCQESFTDGLAACAVGGMLQTQGLDESDLYMSAIIEPCEVLAEVIGINTHRPEDCTRQGRCTCPASWVTSWNDDDDQTVQTVLDALRKAAKVARLGYDPELGYSDV